ncbi:tetratricopeptide repeat protein [Dyadobacter arcticus]|uniref:Tetratricopeptide (TPR) repeat protein n=1 Tax=Dyadobacter arcticus TaxID=1078754 RepID=A0ABX0UMF7_9BACT|nr:hypothetical protein [Dyadobacter arcticus]NIJ54173.1 tetratricopeptide (TPR) repeat protein [Dyadobacter arcticus]
MKVAFISVAFLIFLFGLTVLFLKPIGRKSSKTTIADIAVCGPVYNSEIQPAADGKFIVPLPGWGHHSYPVSTKTDSSQFFFDQGLSMYYGYHFKEAVASFKESARFDPENAMAFWGQALAMGPYYNAAHSYTKPAELVSVLKEMNGKIARTTPKEKLLIDAMNSRYSNDATDSQRESLNIAYAEKLKNAMVAEPGNDDIHILYVDANMLIHAWDFWNKNGTPKAWTAELVDVCKKVLERNPKHPAALHYYIHLTEASQHPEVALGSAETLRDLLPGVAHMVHMSSHEYERNGLYAKGVEVNNLADDNLKYYDLLAKNLSLAKASPHYFAVQTYCALTGGMYKEAMRYALRTRKSVMPTYETTYDQYLYMLPVMTLVRHGKWEEILRDSIRIDSRWTYASLLSDFAKGLAFLNTDQIDSASANLERLRLKSKDPILTKRRIPFNSPVQIAKIAEKTLEGAILFSQKQHIKAIASLEKAVELEDKLIYTEPKDWPVPTRQFLGAYLLKAGKPALAEKVYRLDLVYNPGNGWSGLGLYNSLVAQRKTKQAAGYKTKFQESFAHADEIPSSSVWMK